MNRLLFLLLFCSVTVLPALAQDTLTTRSGLKYVVLKEGEGSEIYANRKVTISYIGKFESGEVFDQSVNFSFVTGQSQVIAGMDEIVRKLYVGSVCTVIIPPDLAYGKRGAGETIPPNTTLIFDIRVLKVESI